MGPSLPRNRSSLLPSSFLSSLYVLSTNTRTYVMEGACLVWWIVPVQGLVRPDLKDRRRGVVRVSGDHGARPCRVKRSWRLRVRMWRAARRERSAAGCGYSVPAVVQKELLGSRHFLGEAVFSFSLEAGPGPGGRAARGQRSWSPRNHCLVN